MIWHGFQLDVDDLALGFNHLLMMLHGFSVVFLELAWNLIIFYDVALIQNIFLIIGHGFRLMFKDLA